VHKVALVFVQIGSPTENSDCQTIKPFYLRTLQLNLAATALLPNLLLCQQLEGRNITFEGALNDRSLDQRSNYWNVPLALSVDLASAGTQSGLRYRVGVHHIEAPEPIREQR
jgi:hypothetical protein